MGFYRLFTPLSGTIPPRIRNCSISKMLPLTTLERAHFKEREYCFTEWAVKKMMSDVSGSNAGYQKQYGRSDLDLTAFNPRKSLSSASV
jgi:hypothetical protein